MSHCQTESLAVQEQCGQQTHTSQRSGEKPSVSMRVCSPSEYEQSAAQDIEDRQDRENRQVGWISLDVAEGRLQT